MLKSEFDIFYQKINNWLFEKYSTFSVAKAFGAREMKDLNKAESFLQLSLLEYVHIANKRRSPLLVLSIPVCIDVNDFNRIISNLKTKLS